MRMRPVLTERLQLRPFSRGDETCIISLYEVEDVRRYLGNAPGKSAPSDQTMVIERAADSSVIGVLSLRPPDWERYHASFEVVVAILPAYRNKGFAREAICGIADRLRGSDFCKSLIARVALSNDKSKQLVRACEFAKVGDRDDPWDGPQEIFELRLTPKSG